MIDETEITDARLFDELQELVSLEVKDIMATAAEGGFAARDVVTALEFALRAEIEALATAPDATDESVAEEAITSTAQ